MKCLGSVISKTIAIIYLECFIWITTSGKDYNLPIKNFFRGDIVFRERQAVIHKAFNADVIVGSVMFSNLNWLKYSNMSFPNLVEITDYLALTSISNLRNLTNIFPQLRIIRGERLFVGYSFILFNVPHLENIGLINLRKIVGGFLYIEGTPNLCYVNSIDWSAIIGANQLIGNYFSEKLPGFEDLRPVSSIRRLKRDYFYRGVKRNQTLHSTIVQCDDVCPSKDVISGNPCPVKRVDSRPNRSLCWNNFHCQSACPGNCSDEGCYFDEKAKTFQCCNFECLTGCWGPGRSQCFACKNFRHLANCNSKCPNETYSLGHLCYTKGMCTSLHPKGKWKAFNGRCTLGCPPNYEEDEADGECKPCTIERCWRECNISLVDNIQSATLFEGCNILKGNLQIHFNDASKDGELRLKKFMSDLRIVTGFVDVSASFGLTSLMFLQSLEVIEGQSLLNNEYSLVIRDNLNLRSLFDMSSISRGNRSKISKLKIMKGRVYLKNNPKLCSVDINQLVEHLNQSRNSPNVTEYQDSNSLYCTGPLSNFSLSVDNALTCEATIKWHNPVHDDMLPSIAWIVHYQPLFKDVCQVDDLHYSCESKWSSIELLPSFNSEMNRSQKIKGNTSENNNNLTYHFAQLKDLAPNQRYAVFIRLVFLTRQERKGFYSETICFETDVAKPSRVREFKMKSVDSRSAILTWLPPKLKRGRINFYVVHWYPSKTDKNDFKSRNYCMEGGFIERSTFTSHRGDNIDDNKEDAYELRTNEQNKSLEGFKLYSSRPTKSSTIASRQRTKEQLDNNDSNSIIQSRSSTSSFMRNSHSETLFDNCCKCTSVVESNTEESFLNYFEQLDEQIERLRGHTEFHKLPKSLHGCIPPLSIVQNYLLFSTNEAYLPCVIDIELLMKISNPNDSFVTKNESFNSKIKLLTGRMSKILLENLTNFQEYVVKIEACNINKDGHVLCGSASLLLFQTALSDGSDLIEDSSLKARLLIDRNQTCPQDSSNCHREVGNCSNICTPVASQKTTNVAFTWNEPQNVNGVIVAYWIKIENVAEDVLAPISMCIDSEEFLARDMEVRLHLLPGNYSWKVKAMSLAGNSTWSGASYFVVPGNQVDIGNGRQISLQTIFLIGFAIPCVFLMLMVIIIYHTIHRVKIKREEDYLKISINPNYLEFRKWEIPKENIQIGEIIGKGQFGSVYKGHLKIDPQSIPVAIKIVRERSPVANKMQFFNEIAIMGRDFDSYHVVKLVGFSYNEVPHLLVMELLDNGDLLSFLRKYRQEAQATKSDFDSNLNDCNWIHDILDSPEASNLEIQEDSIIQLKSRDRLNETLFLGMAAEVADGMAYLASKKFIHRDLAARNCLLDSQLVVKVSDFGMTLKMGARDCCEISGLSKIKNCLPIRWMAPEVLMASVFSEKSDIWSYGVLLWEVFTLGIRPYVGMSNVEVKKFVSGGGKLKCPKECPKVAIEIMEACWSTKTKDRPKFVDIIRSFVEFSKPGFISQSYYSRCNDLDKL